MNIALIGYGNMGREIESIALQGGHTIVACFSSKFPLPSSSSGYYRELKIDCCIDFSSAASVRHNVETCGALGIPLVEGTTGWHEQKNEIVEIARANNTTLVYGTNFSVGAQMFFRIVRHAADLMNSFPEYDTAIHETHHTKKKDAPSGTALTISQILLSSLQRKDGVKESSGMSVIQPNEISISSARIGSVSGTHSVLFHSPADEIELVHRAHNRSGFASGAVLAAELIQKSSGIFTFEEILFEQSLTHQ